MKSPLLVIYAKSPIPGKVKTRLAKGSNGRYAMNAYKRLLASTLGAVAEYPNVVVAASPDIRHGYIRQVCKRYNVKLSKQPQGELGQRMNQSTRIGLRQHSSVVIIGTDCPTIDLNTVLNVQAALNKHAHSICPAHDGGYVLVGSSCYNPALFRQVAWSTASVMRQTQRQARRSRKRLHIGQTMTDIDHIRDWRKARQQKAIAPLWHRGGT